jgi:hypothetical protein
MRLPCRSPQKRAEQNRFATGDAERIREDDAERKREDAEAAFGGDAYHLEFWYAGQRCLVRRGIGGPCVWIR